MINTVVSIPETRISVLLIVRRHQLSTADIAVVARLNWLKDGTLEAVPTTIVDGYPLLSALVDRVMSEPRIVAYVEKLPEPVKRQF